MNCERIFAYTKFEYMFEVIGMKDWREELRSTDPGNKKLKDPDLCSCMANIKGRWSGGVYTCLSCGRPVYDAFGKR